MSLGNAARVALAVLAIASGAARGAEAAGTTAEVDVSLPEELSPRRVVTVE